MSVFYGDACPGISLHFGGEYGNCGENKTLPSHVQTKFSNNQQNNISKGYIPRSENTQSSSTLEVLQLRSWQAYVTVSP
jgi:hypothetical protein